MNSKRFAQLRIAFVVALFLGCGDDSASDAGTQIRHWDGEVVVHGALRAMFHEGQVGALVTLDTMLPDPDLYAVGALAELAGEVTIVGGKVYLSYPEGREDTRTETLSETSVGVTLLATTKVAAWNHIRLERPISFEELDEQIAELAASAGMNVEERIPFLLVGEFEDLQWHVIDGRRLNAGGSSHEDHQASSVQARLDHTSGILVGFYSEGDQGIFTHMGSRTHIHCALDEPLATGHVDHVTILDGTSVKFPALDNE